jgi:molybdopterin synthase sulfur carrier subunit
MKILYFAWLREKTGCREEELDLPAAVTTVGELIAWLRQLDAGHAAAFADVKQVRCAVDMEFAPLQASIGQAREIAFFPPVTGG